MIERSTFLLQAVAPLPLLVMASGAFAFDQIKVLEISLKNKASITEHRVYLSDIASCEGPSNYCGEIRGIDLGTSPFAGRTGFLAKAHVESVLAKEWPNTKINVSGPEMVRLETASIDISADDLRAKLEDLLAVGLKRHGNLRIRVARFQPINQLKVRHSQTKIEFPEVKAMTLDDRAWVIRNLVGNRAVQVKIYNQNDIADASLFQANAYIELEAQIPMPVQTIGVGQKISKQEITRGWVLMRRGYRDVVFDSDLIIDRKARQTIQAGEPISARFLEPAMAVTRNQSVKLLAKSGDLEISARGIAQQSGAVGQTIDVVNSATKRKLKARVLDDRTVEAVSF